MITKIKTDISIGDAAIVCTKIVSFKELLDHYQVARNNSIKQIIEESGIALEDDKASFSGAVSVDSRTDTATAKLLAEARCDLKITKFLKRLVYLIVKGETKQFKNGQTITQRNSRRSTNKND